MKDGVKLFYAPGVVMPAFDKDRVDLFQNGGGSSHGGDYSTDAQLVKQAIPLFFLVVNWT